MRTSSINPGGLIRESFATVGPVYLPLLVLGIPGLIPVLLNSLIQSRTIIGLVNVVVYLLIVPWFSGASIFYTYQYLARRIVTLGEALEYSRGRILQLVLGFILLLLILVPAFILLVIPGIYLVTRLAFTLYPVALENCSATEGIKRSWELVKGRWWSVFIALLIGSFVFLLPVLLISALIGTVLGLDSSSGASQLPGGILGLLVAPLLSVYYILLYRRLEQRVLPS